MAVNREAAGFVNSAVTISNCTSSAFTVNQNQQTQSLPNTVKINEP